MSLHPWHGRVGGNHNSGPPTTSPASPAPALKIRCLVGPHDRAPPRRRPLRSGCASSKVCVLALSLVTGLRADAPTLFRSSPSRYTSRLPARLVTGGHARAAPRHHPTRSHCDFSSTRAHALFVLSNPRDRACASSSSRAVKMFLLTKPRVCTLRSRQTPRSLCILMRKS